MSNGTRQPADQLNAPMQATEFAQARPAVRSRAKTQRSRSSWLDGLIANFGMLVVATAVGLALYVEHNFGAAISLGISALAFITFRLVHRLLAYDRRLKKMSSGLTASSRGPEFAAAETSDLSALTQPGPETDAEMRGDVIPVTDHTLPVPDPVAPRLSNPIAEALAEFVPQKEREPRLPEAVAPEAVTPEAVASGAETLSDLDQAALFPELDPTRDLEPSKDIVDQIARELCEIRPGYDETPVDSLTRDLEAATMKLERSLAQGAKMVPDDFAPADFISQHSMVRTPATRSPATRLPANVLPVNELAGIELPATELPAVEAPVAELPAAEMPAIELPATELPDVAEAKPAPQPQPEPVAVFSEDRDDNGNAGQADVAAEAAEAAEADKADKADKADEAGLHNIVAEAIASCRTQIYLQPILGLATRKAESFEVLTHLEDGRGDVLAPGEYMEEAERAGQMPVIDDAMLKRTIGVLRKLQATNRPGTMFCNLSIFSLSDDGLMNTLIEVLAQEKEVAGRLVIELSEQAYLACTPNDHDKLNALRDLGVRLSLDQIKDAGIFMDALRSQLFSFIKLEAPFFLDRLGSGEDVLLPAEILSEASLAGVELIVDHIDSDTDLERVIEFGAKFGQGHIFSRPRPVKQELLEDAA